MSIKERADQLALLIERASKSAWFLTIYILVLTFAITAPTAIVHLKQELWTIVSANIADNLLSGKGLISTVDPAIGNKSLPPLVWPGPVAIAWMTIWEVLGVSWLFEPALAFICILLIGLIIQRIDPFTSLIAVTICIFHPYLSSSVHYSPDLVLSLALILYAILLCMTTEVSKTRALFVAILSFLGFLTNPIWLPMLVLMPIACGEKTPKLNRLLTLTGFFISVGCLISLKLSSNFSSFLKLYQISDLSWRKIYAAIIPLWRNFISSPLSLLYLLCLLHGFRERKKVLYNSAVLVSSFFSVILLPLSPFSYYSAISMNLKSFTILFLFTSLIAASWGFERILSAISLENEGRKRLVQVVAFLIIFYVMGINAVQKQILKIILISDNLPTWKQQREALFTARAQLPPDEWLLVIDEWELAYGMSNIIVFREVARLDSEEKTPLFAREFNAIFLSESKDFKLPLLKEFSFESWKCKNIDGYKLCSKLLDD